MRVALSVNPEKYEAARLRYSEVVTLALVEEKTTPIHSVPTPGNNDCHLPPLSLGHFSPIFSPFFPVFSPFSPSGPQDSRNRHQDPEKRSETVAKRSRKGGLKPFNRKRRADLAGGGSGHQPDVAAALRLRL